LIPFYLDEEEFDKEVLSWTSVKRNPYKFGMHYLFPAELLKKRDRKKE
jgi:hypothetical protein